MRLYVNNTLYLGSSKIRRDPVELKFIQRLQRVLWLFFVVLQNVLNTLIRNRWINPLSCLSFDKSNCKISRYLSGNDIEGNKVSINIHLYIKFDISFSKFKISWSTILHSSIYHSFDISWFWTIMVFIYRYIHIKT